MKHVRFYYVRHGRTEFNRDGICQGGRVDSPLVEESLGQVEATARAIMGVELARCYASPLGRAMQTARIVWAGRPGAIQPLDDLREFDFGELDGKPYQGTVPLRFARCFVRQDFTSVGGESGAQVRARVRRAFGRMYQESQDGQNVLVVAHGALLRYVLLEYYLAVGPVRRKLLSETLHTPNGCIAVIEAVDGRFELTRLPQSAADFLAR